MSDVDLSSMRRVYERTQLREEDVSANPIEQLRAWVHEAHDTGSAEPNAMCLCTMGEEYPAGRIVLMRGLDEQGLVFFTSYFSRKGHDLERVARAGAVFYWPQLERQVRVEGDVQKLAEEESDAYFAGRPRGHQLGAWASEQSEPVESREILDQRMLDFKERFGEDEIPRPHSWGGYRLRPKRIEFWQGRPNRMHDRIEFRRTRTGWTLQRLSP